MSVIIYKSLGPWRLVRSLVCVVVQQKKQRPSGFWRLVTNENDTPQCAALLASQNAVKENWTTLHSPKIPTVRTTLPSEDFNEEKTAIPRFSESATLSVDASPIVEKCPLPSEITKTKQSHQKGRDVFGSAKKARKFHLVKGSSPISSALLVSKTMAQKRRTNRRKELAIFVERTEIIREAKKSGDISRPGSGEPIHLDSGEKRDISQLERPRKRPNATAAERRWRTETWAKPSTPNEVNKNLARTAESVNESSSQSSHASIKLTKQLQGFALEEIRASEERTKGLSDGENLKVKPKPPKPRQPMTEEVADDGNEERIMTDNINLDDDGVYVLDTYVRSSAQPFGVAEPTGSYHDSLRSIDHGIVGILVIEDEEEELWEAFTEGQEDDLEWNSEEEDENGL